jgi:hypothetical protein
MNDPQDCTPFLLLPSSHFYHDQELCTSDSMSRKRKADLEAEELEFRKNVQKIPNPYVQTTYLRTFGEEGEEVDTITSSRRPYPGPSTAPVVPNPPDPVTSIGSDKKQTQVSVVISNTNLANYLLLEFETAGRFPRAH